MKRFQRKAIIYLLGILLTLTGTRLFVEDYLDMIESDWMESIVEVYITEEVEPEQKNDETFSATTKHTTRKKEVVSKKITTNNQVERKTTRPAPVETVVIQINTANVDKWQSLRGIGPVLSARICKFRDKLGGFHSISQIGEVYGLPPETFAQIRPLLECDGVVKKLNPLTAEFKTLLYHPYLQYDEVKGMMQYQRNRRIKSIDDLMNATGKSKEDALNLMPYLDLKQEVAIAE